MTKRRGFDQAQRRVVIGDGAPWIWNIADEHFPGAIQIVDLYHAKGHLWDVAKAIYGAGSDLAEQWAKQRRDELDDGKIDNILAAFALHVKTNEEARKCFDYVTRNRHRMLIQSSAPKVSAWVQALSKQVAKHPIREAVRGSGADLNRFCVSRRKTSGPVIDCELLERVLRSVRFNGRTTGRRNYGTTAVSAISAVSDSHC